MSAIAVAMSKSAVVLILAAVFYALTRNTPKDEADARLDAFERDPEAVALRAFERERETARNGDGTAAREYE